MRFFTINTQTTFAELRRRYKDLCKRYYPDKGGSDTVQAQINVEYQQALQQLAETAKQKENEASYDRLIHRYPLLFFFPINTCHSTDKN